MTTNRIDPKTGSITVEQNLNAVEQLGITGGPVAGVEYTLAQIGSLCEITYTGGYMTGYAVEKSTAKTLGIEDAANYTGSHNGKIIAFIQAKQPWR